MSDHDQPDRYGPEPKPQHWCATCRGHTGPDSPCYKPSEHDEDLSTQPAAPLPAVPDGWQLVPVEPSDAMHAAGAIEMRIETTALNKLWMCKKAWKAMLTAAKEQTP